MYLLTHFTFHRADTFNSQSRLNPPHPEQNALSLRPAGGALAALTCTDSTPDLSGLHRRSHAGGFIVGMDLCLPAGARREIERDSFDINRLTPPTPVPETSRELTANTCLRRNHLSIGGHWPKTCRDAGPLPRQINKISHDCLPSRARSFH